MSRYGGGTWYSNIHRSTSSSEGSEYSVSDGSLQTKFHTYSLDWGDGFIDYYFDGEFYKRATGDIATFQKNCHLIINTGLGGWEYEPNSQTVWNTGLQLDWVRAYQW
jgi:beta-glucanase (GH16 family)